MTHIVLLGDSIFDNSRYTEGGPDVISQVRQLLPVNWRASLLAVVGSTTEDVPPQLQHLPPDSSHLVLSVGGNDALMNSSILHNPADSTSQLLQHWQTSPKVLRKSIVVQSQRAGRWVCP